MATIPRNIIQSHESQFTLSGTFKKCQKSIRSCCNDFDYHFFSASGRRNFVAERRPDLLALYDFYPRAVQRSDLFRFIAIHEMGGFYMDLDLVLHESVAPLCQYGLVLTEEWKMTPADYRRRHFGEPDCEEDLVQLGNYAFGAAPRHWFTEAVLDEMVHRAQAIDSGRCRSECIFFTTGPDLLSSVYRNNRNRLQEENCMVLKGSDEDRWCQFGGYGTHLMAGSWVRRKVSNLYT